jgi:hypothetical protein
VVLQAASNGEKKVGTVQHQNSSQARPQNIWTVAHMHNNNAVRPTGTAAVSHLMYCHTQQESQE